MAARHVFIGECRTFVEFARPKSTDAHFAEQPGQGQHVVLDWRCALCNFVNFAKVVPAPCSAQLRHTQSLTPIPQRGACKQCNSPRDPNAELVDPSAAKTDWSSLHVEEGINPCDTLIVKVCRRRYASILRLRALSVDCFSEPLTSLLGPRRSFRREFDFGCSVALQHRHPASAHYARAGQQHEPWLLLCRLCLSRCRHHLAQELPRCGN